MLLLTLKIESLEQLSNRYSPQNRQWKMNSLIFMFFHEKDRLHELDWQI